jgi:hypothetical protein
MRSIIGCPFEELAREAAEIDAMEKPPMGSRKLAGLHAQVASLLASTDLCAQLFEVKRMCVLLGPSANNPLESYTIEFVGTADSIDQTSSPSEKQISAARRRVLQALIQEQACWDAPPAPRTSAFIAIEAASMDVGAAPEKVFADFGFRDSFRGPAHQSAEEKGGAERAVTCLGKRKARKPALLVRVHWKGPVTVEAAPQTVAEAVGTETGCAVPEPAEDVEIESSAWLVSKKGVKTMRI